MIKNKINEINKENKIKIEKNKKINKEKNKLNKKCIIIFFLFILINILQFSFIKNKYFNYIFLAAIPMVLIYYLFTKNKLKNKEININNNLKKVNKEIEQLNYEINLLEKNNIEINKEINKLENNFNSKIKNNNFTDINLKIQNIENKLSGKKIKLHTLQLDYQNIESKLENLSSIEEKIVDSNNKKVNLEKLEKSMNLAKEVLENAYDKMKNTVTPKFTDKLSETIAQITERKYTKVRFNDDTGLLVELENGNYVQASRLSIGTIEQLYFSLRLAMAEELSKEKMPIILDEAFAYYDTKRLKNILKYISERFRHEQILLFTCTNREKEILEELNIKFNLIEM